MSLAGPRSADVGPVSVRSGVPFSCISMNSIKRASILGNFTLGFAFLQIHLSNTFLCTYHQKTKKSKIQLKLAKHLDNTCFPYFCPLPSVLPHTLIFSCSCFFSSVLFYTNMYICSIIHLQCWDPHERENT